MSGAYERPSTSILTRSIPRSSHLIARTAALAGSVRIALIAAPLSSPRMWKAIALTPGKARPRQRCSAGEALSEPKQELTRHKPEIKAQVPAGARCADGEPPSDAVQ